MVNRRSFSGLLTAIAMVATADIVRTHSRNLR
jgi:hypothetical protein